MKKTFLDKKRFVLVFERIYIISQNKKDLDFQQSLGVEILSISFYWDGTSLRLGEPDPVLTMAPLVVLLVAPSCLQVSGSVETSGVCNLQPLPGPDDWSLIVGRGVTKSEKSHIQNVFHPSSRQGPTFRPPPPFKV